MELNGVQGFVAVGKDVTGVLHAFFAGQSSLSLHHFAGRALRVAVLKKALAQVCPGACILG